MKPASAFAGLVMTVLLASMSGIPTAGAAGEPCTDEADLIEIGMDCEEPMSKSDARAHITKNGTGAQATHVYRTVGQCTPGSERENGDCSLRACPGSEPGRLYSLEESPIASDPRVWTHLAFVCLESADELQTISAADVAREFKRLTWPAARMTIQPPDGETLVNLPTIFFTNDTDTVTQTVTLLGQTVEIEASPAEWTWHWTTGASGTSEDRQPFTTADPGSPHPNATVTHAYTRAGITVRPRLDVTYRGQFRVNNGPWEDIPETHTVTGSPASLRVLEARPILVQ